MSVRDHLAIYRRTISRPRAPVIFAAAAVLCVGACSNRSESEPATEFSADLNVGGDASPVVTRSLQRGDYLIEAREHEIDVHMTVEAGESRTELEDRVPRHGALYQVVSMAAPGELRITVRSDDHRTKQGRTALRIARWNRPPEARRGERPPDAAAPRWRGQGWE